MHVSHGSEVEKQIDVILDTTWIRGNVSDSYKRGHRVYNKVYLFFLR